jgi:hypothetical protein
VAAWNDVKNWTRKAISIAVNMISGGLDLIDYAFTVTANAISAAASWWWSNVVIPSWDWIQHAADTVGGWIWDAVVGFYHAVIVPALGLLGDALNFAVGALQWAINQAAAGLSWLIDNVINPAYQWVLHAAETVAGWIWDAVDGFYRDVIAPLINDAEFWAHLLASAWDWLVHTVAAVVNAVLAAWGWIIWFGEHTFSDILALLDGTNHEANRNWLLGVAGHPDGWAEKLVDDLANLLA